MKKLRWVGSFMFILAVVLIPVMGIGEEMPKTMLCSVLKTVDCPMGEKCWRGSAKDLNFPQFVTLNFAEKIISGKLHDGQNKTATIDKIIRNDGKIILQGMEKRAWNLTLLEATGEFSASATDEDKVLGVFGACIIQE